MITFKPSNKEIIEFIGWVGMSILLLAYALVSIKLIPSNGYIYQLLNFFGATGIVIVSLFKKANQPALLNIIWAIIAFISLIVIFMNIR